MTLSARNRKQLSLLKQITDDILASDEELAGFEPTTSASLDQLTATLTAPPDQSDSLFKSSVATLDVDDDAIWNDVMHTGASADVIADIVADLLEKASVACFN